MEQVNLFMSQNLNMIAVIESIPDFKDLTSEFDRDQIFDDAVREVFGPFLEAVRRSPVRRMFFAATGFLAQFIARNVTNHVLSTDFKKMNQSDFPGWISLRYRLATHVGGSYFFLSERIFSD